MATLKSLDIHAGVPHIPELFEVALAAAESPVPLPRDVTAVDVPAVSGGTTPVLKRATTSPGLYAAMSASSTPLALSVPLRDCCGAT